MSLERNKEDVQQTEQKSSQEKKTVYPFTREFLKMQMQKKNQQRKTASTSPTQETAEQTEIPLPELDQLNLMIRDLAQKSGVTSEEAKKDERVILLAAATLQMCQLLQSFTATISTEMEKISQRELQNLNLQKQYAESVRASTVEVGRDIYRQFIGEQKQAFKEVTKYLSGTNDEMEKSIYECTKEVKKATQNAVRSAKRLRKIKTIVDLLYHAAPLLVLIDIILRVVALAAQIS